MFNFKKQSLNNLSAQKLKVYNIDPEMKRSLDVKSSVIKQNHLEILAKKNKKQI